MERVFNFSAGPSMLPVEVLEKASKEMLCYGNSGMSVMEMSHRSNAYQEIFDKTESSLRDVINIPDNYKVLFLQGGASTQFAMVPLNLLKDGGKADYAVTGSFAKKAFSEAKRYGDVKVVGSSEDKGFTYIPEFNKEDFTKDARYFHITTNNTIYGTRYTELPDVGDVPLVADMSSNILSEEVDVTKFGIIYAGAQKNMGPAGVTTVIIREDLLGNAMSYTPSMMNYETLAKAGSMYNTPPTYSIYIAGMVFDWVKSMGGLKGMAKHNNEKAKLLYDYIDESKLFKGTANKKDRSIMNATFVLPTDDLNAKFIKEAASYGFMNIKGHRSVGGMRASIYNAMPKEGIVKLVDFMKQFEMDNK